MRVAAAIEAVNPLLRGWASCFRWAEVKNVLQELDGWLRRKLKLRGRLRKRLQPVPGADEAGHSRGERAWRSGQPTGAAPGGMPERHT